jgi:uncharacterized membrane protein
MHIMKNIFLLFLLLCLIFSCASKQRQQEIVSQMQAANAEKIRAEKNLADFKTRVASDFKEYDSLKAKGVVPTVIQMKHDSLVTKGISLAMKLVHRQMKIDSLQKMN